MNTASEKAMIDLPVGPPPVCEYGSASTLRFGTYRIRRDKLESLDRVPALVEHPETGEAMAYVDGEMISTFSDYVDKHT